MYVMSPIFRLKFGGDNFVRQSGDVKNFARAQSKYTFNNDYYTHTSTVLTDSYTSGSKLILSSSFCFSHTLLHLVPLLCTSFLSFPPHTSLLPLTLFPLYSSPLTVFAWETYEHGTDIHPLADPTKLELMHKDFHVKKEDFKDEQQQSVLEKYGGEEHLDAPPKELLLAQTVSE